MRNVDILILCPFFSPNIGGVETHLDDWCAFLSDNNIRALVVTFQPITVEGDAPSTEDRGSVKIFRYNWIGGNLFHRLEKMPLFEFLYLTPYLFLCSLWTLLIKGYHTKVIHSHGLNAAFVGFLLKKLFRIPCVLSTHAVYSNSRESLMAKVSAWIINRLDKVLCLSNASLDQLKSFGVKSEKIDRYTYWVNQDVFKPHNVNDAKKELCLNSKFSVLFVGRLIKIKGIQLFLEVAKQCPQWTFMIVGTGPLEDEVSSAAQSNVNISFFGRQPNHRLPLFFNAADVFVIPSQYEEGFGRVIIEALSCGCPVIGTKKGGIPEALSNGGGIITGLKRKDIILSLKKIDQESPKRKEIHKIANRYYSPQNGNKILSYLKAF